ncbi:MAG: hypothetical protein KTR17_04595 [Cellvibrionaceae bacterium]|nr:hypothetical protein [Cellvibrionaceae bacterium]
MALVKDAKLRPLKIVEYNPLKKNLKRGLIAAGFVVAIVASFYYGYTTGAAQQKEVLSDVEGISEELEKVKQGREELEQQIANLKMGALVDQQASEDVRQEVITLKENLASLKEENSFYRNLMAPTGNKRGLNFGTVEVVDTETPRVYSYKIVLQQLATRHKLLQGTLKFTIIGKQDETPITFKLKEVSSDVTQDIIKLRFKYFQTIQGKLTLPAGFEPEAIELVARSIGKQAVTIEKRFGWLVEES